MFTGIVEELGSVATISHLVDDSVRITINASVVLDGSDLGDSIAVNGVCLTVTQRDSHTFSADVMKETLSMTTIGSLQTDSPVNLERPVTLATRLGGHIVQGHVDGVGRIISREHSQNWDVVTIEPPQHLLKYIVHKGSITVDGTSLTISAVTDTTFSVSLIPVTLANTTLGVRAIGDSVNLEVDMLAKYVEKLVGASS